MHESIRLNLGCGTDYRPGYLNIEHPMLNRIYKADMYWDLEDGLPFGPDIEAGTVDEVHVYHILEHISNFRKIWGDIYSALRQGGRLYIRVPSAQHKCAFGDPTHVRFFTDETFTLFLDKENMNRDSKQIYVIETLEVWNDGQIYVCMVKI